MGIVASSSSPIGSGTLQQRKRDKHTKIDPQTELPPELFLKILEFISLSDVPNAACVCKAWNNVVTSNQLWMRFAIQRCPPLRLWVNDPNVKWRSVFRSLVACVYVFNNNTALGIDSLVHDFYVPEGTSNVARFLRETSGVSRKQLAELLFSNREYMVEFIQQLNVKGLFLADALRVLFDHVVPAPGSGVNRLLPLLNVFSDRFCEVNPQMEFTKDSICLLCLSLCLLSVDMTNPHVRNKMSKREFVRSNREWLPGQDEFLGRLYDNVYLFGHIAEGRRAARNPSRRILDTKMLNDHAQGNVQYAQHFYGRYSSVRGRRTLALGLGLVVSLLVSLVSSFL